MGFQPKRHHRKKISSGKSLGNQILERGEHWNGATVGPYDGSRAGLYTQYQTSRQALRPHDNLIEGPEIGGSWSNEQILLFVSQP